MVARQVPLVETILRPALVCFAVVLLIRAIGKRGLAELSTFDIVVTALLAQVVGAAASRRQQLEQFYDRLWPRGG
jgi:uncharacterized membrane protein YcaP (DUF421 family)